jgi:hypothetical protein
MTFLFRVVFYPESIYRRLICGSRLDEGLLEMLSAVPENLPAGRYSVVP